MRILIALPLLALAACNVSHDSGNDSTTLSFNQDVAENAIEDAGNTAQNVAADVGNTVEDAGNKIDNVNVDIDTDGNDANTAANVATNTQ